MSIEVKNEELKDADSLHYARANELERYSRIKHALSGEDRDDWLEWFEESLNLEIQYAAENRNKEENK